MLLFLLPCTILGQQTRQYKILTVGFYNLENLFDTMDDPLTFDNDWTPEGKYNWTLEKYRSKLKNLAAVMGGLNDEYSVHPPEILGVCEVENRAVLEDLIREEPFNSYDYSVVHFDSPDRRGIDVALIYRTKVFLPTHEKSIRLLLFENDDLGKRIYTRDMLLVSGLLDGEPIHLVVNHWPSRRGGEESSRPRRIAASKRMKQIVDSLWTEDPYSKIICMGDFNDDPNSPSIRNILKPILTRKNAKLKRLFNPMEVLHRKGYGTLAYRDNWNLFDQFLISSELLKKDYGSLRFFKADIHNDIELQTASGRYKGYPFRSNNNGLFTGGYSDHYPVYLYLIKEADTTSEGK
ncbi:endonuclease/exonuclease/phosphatase family protein [Aureitalea sp. L0-47]|nr:endonuclease/exonuclease/phosphatase family protein [Aureitalea sp. L0-47]